MDLSTFIGLILGAAAVATAVWANPGGLYDGKALLVVVVGGIATGLVAYPFSEVRRIFGIVCKTLFSAKGATARKLVEQIVGFAETARREGILALEQAVQEVDDCFMASGIRLAVDGTHPELVQTILETELTFVEERHREGQRLLRVFGIGWAVFGGVYTLAILSLGPVSGDGGVLMAQVSLPLLYGLLLCGLFSVFLPRKLAVRTRRESMHKRMIMEGIMSIQSGDNPRIVEYKLNVFIAPKQRAVNEEPTEPEPKPPAEAPAADPEVLQKVKEGISRLSVALQQEKALPDRISIDDLLELAPEEKASILEELGEEASPPPHALFAFKLDDLADLSDREVQMILREIDARDCAIALLGAEDGVRDRIFSNVSERVGTMIKEEMGRHRSAKVRDIVDVHLRIMHVVQWLRAVKRL